MIFSIRKKQNLYFIESDGDSASPSFDLCFINAAIIASDQ